jgi:hypothetical protein
MGHKLRDRGARIEYALLRMDIALKRTLSCDDAAQWDSAWKWATLWGVAARTYSPTACLLARKCLGVLVAPLDRFRLCQ